MIYSSDDELPENGEGVVIARAIIDYKNMVFVDNLKNDEAIVSIEELKNVIDRIIEIIKPENKIQKGRIKIEDFIEGFEKLSQSGSYTNIIRGNMILINISDRLKFRNSMKYDFIEGRNIYFSFLKLCGREIPVFASELVPKGTMLLFDNSKIGRLLLRKKYSIKQSESRFREIAGFDKENPNAVVMFKHEIKEG